MSSAQTASTTDDMATGDALVHARGLVRRFGAVTALDVDEMVIPKGITGMIGPNGAGKTTLLGLMLGLHAADAGEISVLGLDPVRAGPEVRSRIGYAPEHRRLPEDIKAVDFVRHIAEVHGIPPTPAKTRASDALWLVGLGEERGRPLGTLSTGQLQRVKLAQAIVPDPRLVLLDEPTDGLDPSQRDSMLSLIHRVGTEFGMSVVLSSHVLEEVERICEGIVVLAEGRLVAQGGMAELTGALGGIELDCGDAPRARVALERAGVRVDEGDRHGVLLVAGDPDQLSRQIRDVLAAEHVALRRLQPRTAHLADVFLDMVE
ncbi:MAG: ABC transporter ATP-binding protein [Thermoleophilia bacterium]|nr:ABC transporter ATP-binding protein [Thermoleophilia bacterium]